MYTFIVRPHLLLPRLPDCNPKSLAIRLASAAGALFIAEVRAPKANTVKRELPVCPDNIARAYGGY